MYIYFFIFIDEKYIFFILLMASFTVQKFLVWCSSSHWFLLFFFVSDLNIKMYIKEFTACIFFEKFNDFRFYTPVINPL